MTIKILLSVIFGIIAGRFISVDPDFISIISDVTLLVLLFFVGLDIGKERGVIDMIRGIGFKVLFVPLSVIVGSVIGGLIGGVVLKIALNEAGAIGAGLGWYSLSGTLLANEGFVEAGFLAFMSNVFREVLALIFIPLIATHIGYLETVAAGGAAAMDTILPVISESTDKKTTIIAFISGVICTACVPIIVPLIVNLG